MSDRFLSIATRLREYRRNPHHINPMSERFDRLIEEAAQALVEASKAKQVETATP